MDLGFSSVEHQNLNEVVSSDMQPKNSNSCSNSFVVKIGGNGKTCHQCRQKKENFVAICNNIKKGKNCSIKFCDKCLLTRYGENAEEVGQLGDWICPKCRGFCNCSFCRKKQGEQPTGPLYRSAKESGFKSVAEMLATKKASEALELNKVNDVAVLSSDETTGKKELEVHMPNVVKLEKEVIEDEIPLPPGIELTQILDIDLTHKDVGNAFQFLEFCTVFGRVLGLANGEAIAILKGLGHQPCLDGRNNNLVIQFLIKLLMLILNDSRIESLTKLLEGLVRESYHILHDFPLDWLQKGFNGYHELNLSQKFKLLIFLCDEALSTQKMRSFINEENKRYLEERKYEKIKFAAAKEKEKVLRQKLKNEMANVVSGSTRDENENDLSIIKNEVTTSKEDMFILNGSILKGKYSDAVRIEPEFVDNNGQSFWKLEYFDDQRTFLFQDVKIQDGVSSDENWFVYGPDKKDEIDKYISYRTKKLKSSKVSHKLGH